MTKERPIPFMPDMVRALLDGSKTQTRRAMKTQMLYGDICGLFPSWYLPTGLDSGKLWPNGKEKILATCPYGQPGDRLRVKEHYRLAQAFDSMPPRDVPNRIGVDGPPGQISIHYEADGAHDPLLFGKFRPGMFMCRWMSRITLEIVSVRVERLQDISAADAKAEGVRASYGEPFDAAHTISDRRRYELLWESINGPNTWALNPWVWAIEFKRVKP